MLVNFSLGTTACPTYRPMAKFCFSTSAALLVLGLGHLVAYGPELAPAAPSAADSNLADAVERRYLSGPGEVVVLLRPAALLISINEQPVTEKLNALMKEKYGLTAEEISLLVYNSSEDGSSTLRGKENLLLRSTTPTDWQPLLERLNRHWRTGAPIADSATGEERQTHGKRYYILGDIAYFQPDERTIVFDRPEQIEKYLAGEPAEKGMLDSDAWLQVADAHLAVAIDRSPLHGLVAPFKSGHLGRKIAIRLEPLAPLWLGTRSVHAGITWNEQLEIEIHAVAAHTAAVQAIAEAGRAGLTVADQYAREAEQTVRQGEHPEKKALMALVKTIQRLIEGAELNQENDIVSLRASVSSQSIKVAPLHKALQRLKEAPED